MAFKALERVINAENETLSAKEIKERDAISSPCKVKYNGPNFNKIKFQSSLSYLGTLPFLHFTFKYGDFPKVPLEDTRTAPRDGLLVENLI